MTVGVEHGIPVAPTAHAQPAPPVTDGFSEEATRIQPLSASPIGNSLKHDSRQESFRVAGSNRSANHSRSQPATPKYPTFASLDAIEAMEAGQKPDPIKDVNPDGGTAKKKRRFGWPVKLSAKGEEKGNRLIQTRARALVRTRVEPKTFFANERTFLSWLQISVLIMFMGLTLLGNSGSDESGLQSASGSNGSHIAGMIIAPVAFIFTLYALFMYKRRTYQILKRENVRYDDQTGPVLLVLLLTAALVATTIITAIDAFGN